MPQWITGSEDLLELWALTYEEEKFIAEKPEKAWLDYAIRIKFYCIYGRFPKQSDIIPDSVINYLADQIQSPDTNWPSSAGSTARRRNFEVKKFVGFESLEGEGRKRLHEWFHAQSSFFDMTSDQVEARLREWCISNRYEPPPNREIERLINAVHSKFELAECERINGMFSEDAKELMLLSINAEPGVPSILDMRADPGQVGRDKFNMICERLQFISELKIPLPYIKSINEDWRKKIVRRVTRYRPMEIRRMNDERQIGMYAVFLTSRIPEITDALITMLIDSVHKIEKKAISNIQKIISKQVHNIYNFQKTLADILEATFKSPEEPISDVIFNIINEKDALAFIEQQKAKNKWAIDVFNIMHGSWRTHYRSMLINLLNSVEFGSTVTRYKPILEALEWIKNNFDRRTRVYVRDKEMPIEGVVPKEYLKAVVRGPFVDKMSYELCTIITLRKKLSTRELWVPGSEKYKNPEEDVPQDFEERRVEYYQELNLDLNAKNFIAKLKDELREQLTAFDHEFPGNKFVRINHANKTPTFRLTPLDAQQEPEGLAKIKDKIAEDWNMTSLLDMMKEAMLDTRFDKAFESIGVKQVLKLPELQKRLLLVLYALGTNTGVKRISAASDEATYENLRHVRRRFVDVESLREANRILVNEILRIRDPLIWGQMGTAVASDSKAFKAWDKNPMAENHMRYGGNVIMAYWSVEGRNITCIMLYNKW